MARIPTLDESLLQASNYQEHDEAQREALRTGWRTVEAPAPTVAPAPASIPPLGVDPLEGYSEQDRVLINVYSRTMFGQTSEYTGEVLSTIPQILAHAHADLKKQEQQAELRRVASIQSFGTPDEKRALHASMTDEEKESRREANRAAHRAKQARIENARQAWKEAVKKRNEALTAWNAYVQHLHDEFKRVRAEERGQ